VRLLTGMLFVALALAVAPACDAATRARGPSAPRARAIAQVLAESPSPAPRRPPGPSRHVPRAHTARPVRLARREASGHASLRQSGSSSAVRVSAHTQHDLATGRLPVPRHPQRRHRAVPVHAGRGPPGPRPRPQPRYALLQSRAPRAPSGAPRRTHHLPSRARPHAARVPDRLAAPESSDARPPPARVAHPDLELQLLTFPGAERRGPQARDLGAREPPAGERGTPPRGASPPRDRENL
jgi:hypothetical protein